MGVLNSPPVTSAEGLRGVLGLTHWLQDHCMPEYAMGLKAATRYLRKGAEWPMDEAGQKGLALM